MAIHTARGICDDTTANQEAAATAGRIYLHTTSGSKYLLPERDSGSAWEPFRAEISIPIISPTGTSYNYVTTGTYAAILASASMYLDFTRFRQARLTSWCAVQVGSTSATVKVVDTTNTQDITGVITVNSTTASRKSSTWASLNSATYGGDAEFEVQALEGVAADVLRVFSLQLELR